MNLRLVLGRGNVGSAVAHRFLLSGADVVLADETAPHLSTPEHGLLRCPVQRQGDGARRGRAVGGRYR